MNTTMKTTARAFRMLQCDAIQQAPPAASYDFRL